MKEAKVGGKTQKTIQQQQQQKLKTSEQYEIEFDLI